MSEKRSLESHISADLPIKGKEEDRLNRSGFAEALANVVRSWRDKPSLVVGLFGDWGSGKSSLKNLVLESMGRDGEKSLYVVEFSPWQVSGQELLSETFFREIGKILGKTGPSEEAVVKRRVARWKKYAGILSIAATVARAFRSAVPLGDHTGLALTGVATSVEGLAAVTKAGAEAAEAEGAADSLTLSELKEQISEDLRSLDRPILVVLDDIDRLTKEEIRHTVQLIKANADFPNIVYLVLAQKKSVLDALKEIAPDNPLAYLEKIIQVSFDVPVVNRKQLQDVFLKGLNELLTGPDLEKRFSSDYWGAVFPHLFSLFRNLRDLNRFLGALAFHIQLFKNGDTFEANHSHVGKTSASPTDTPSGPEGEELIVEFTVCGRNFLGLNGGPKFVPNETVSFIILTEDQAETDRLWNAIVSNGGQESMCGWCKDRWGFSWQITPRALLAATQDPDRAAAKRVMNAMMTMRKIDIPAIEAARAG